MTTTGSPRKVASDFLLRCWYQKSLGLWLLWPLSLLYQLLSGSRRYLYRAGLLSCWQAPLPLIVVGNITVGGTGKTPMVIALVQALQQAGYRPGIVSRGYGSRAPHYPFLVTADKNPRHCGDEPLLIALRTGVPVVIDANRVAAAQYLIDNKLCDVIVSDDGLQHYALGRDIEIVMVDGQRGFGNQWLLPAGPLREPLSRLQHVDFIVSNGKPFSFDSLASVHSMQLQPVCFYSLDNKRRVAVHEWQQSRQVHAIAGIGNPNRFYHSLQQVGLSPIAHDFSDHHDYCADDLQFDDKLPLIMTEKDAVKVRHLAIPENSWYMPVDAELDGAFFEKILQRLTAIKLVAADG
jgi:tetraacyldisaccharide 4'-kinase